MRLSARHQVGGKVAGIESGRTAGHVRTDAGGTSMMLGGNAVAVIEASDVVIGTH